MTEPRGNAISPLVTAVIPTRNRPELVYRAVHSVLGQTYANLEVVVVVDGLDPATVKALEALSETRLRIVVLSDHVGGCEARNTGVREARGEWIALLDDDDEWLAEKIEKQIGSIVAADRDIIFSATKYLDKQHGRSSIQPRLFPSIQQHISEYLFCEMDIFSRRTSFLQTSTWMVRRSFFLTHPFTPGLRRNQDTDWLLRAFPGCDDHSLFVPEPLAIFHRQSGLVRISTTPDWQETYRWVQDNSALFSRRAIAFLLMTQCARNANRQGSGLDAILFLWNQCDDAVRRSPQLILCFLIALLHLAAHSLRRSWIWIGRSESRI